MKNRVPVNLNIMAIDIGLNYLGACTTTTHDHFLLDGHLLKSWSFFYLKKVHELEKINPQSKRIYKYKQKNLAYINQYIFKVNSYLKRYCKKNKIHTIIIGKIPTKKIKKNNLFFDMDYDYQNVNSYIMSCMYYETIDMAKQNNISVVFIDEAHTSNCSFYDNEWLIYKHRKGRVCRGRFKTFDGHNVHADINASLNFFRKNEKCERLLDFEKAKERMLLHPRKVFFPDNNQKKL